MSLLELVCEARYRGPLLKHEKDLRKELYNHRRTWPRKAPTRQAILYWFKKKSEPSDQASKDFLLSYLRTFAAKSPISAEQTSAINELEPLLTTDANHERKTREAAGAPRRSDKGDPYVVAMFALLLERGWRADRREDDDFFYCSPFDSPNTQDDESYYIAYRHSTTDKQILKIFVVIKKPTPGLSRQYSFRVFVRGGQSEAHATRESQGIILRYDTSYYLLGYNYHVVGERATDPETHHKRRIHAKSNPTSLITVAVEYLDIGVDRGLFPALTMSTAAQNQPVIARVAVLHLGTRSSLGRQISHMEIDPTQLPPEELAQDLYEIVSNLQQGEAVKFGITIDEIVRQGNLEKSSFDPLAAEIMKMVDNVPAVEKLTLDGKPSLDEQRAQGAIETFARRAGTRPRP